MDIQQLVNASVAGDQRAFRDLALDIAPKLSKWFTVRFGILDGEDVAQDTLIVAWEKLPGFKWRDELGFISWVFEIGRLMALVALRQQDRQLDAPRALAEVGQTPPMGLSTFLSRAERIEEVRREVDKLPPSLRRAADNIMADGDAREYAAEIGLAWGTMRGYESRAIDLLRRRLRPPRPTPTP